MCTVYASASCLPGQMVVVGTVETFVAGTSAVQDYTLVLARTLAAADACQHNYADPNLDSEVDYASGGSSTTERRPSYQVELADDRYRRFDGDGLDDWDSASSLGFRLEMPPCRLRITD